MAQRNLDSQLPDLIDLREAEIAKIASSAEDLAELRRHLHAIVGEKAFRGSNRSAQFLTHVVEQALAGHFESLKERVIGIELFGRSPSYDTSEDAIVRVTASDVRKRLLQFYSESGGASKFRVGLPSGSYIPEITRVRHDNAAANNQAADASGSQIEAKQASANGHLGSSPIVGPQPFTANAQEVRPTPRLGTRFTLYAVIVLLCLNLFLGAAYWYRSQRVHATDGLVPPWSALFNAAHPTHVITSDPNIVFVQTITGGEISVSDYANRKYIPESNKLTPEELRLCRTILWGDNSAASVDPPIAVKISALAQRGSKHPTFGFENR